MTSVLGKRFAVQAFTNIAKLCRNKAIQPACKRSLYVSPRLFAQYFTDKHEWIDLPEGQDVCTVGITDFAQDKLGEIIYVQLPDVGQELEFDGDAGVLESVKAASDICSPLSGEVTEVNESVADKPEIINTDPFGEGWLYKMKLADPSETSKLMSESEYKVFLTAEA